MKNIRPLVILLGGLAWANLCMTQLLHERFIKNELFAVGLMIGEMMFLFILAGGMGRAWVFNLLLACVYAVFGWIMTLLIRLTRPGEFFDAAIQTIAIFPALVFAGALPFLCLRGLCGYRLGQSSHAQPAGRSITIQDFFLTTTVMGAMLVPVLAVARVYSSEIENFVTLVCVAGVFCAVISLLMVLPVTWTYFSSQARWLRLTILIVLCAGVPFVAERILSYWAGVSILGNSMLDGFAPLISTAMGCFAMCLVVTRSIDFRWVRDQRLTETSIEAPLHPTEDKERPVVTDRAARLNRVCALVLLTIGVVQVIAYESIAGQRRRINPAIDVINGR